MIRKIYRFNKETQKGKWIEIDTSAKAKVHIIGDTIEGGEYVRHPALPLDHQGKTHYLSKSTIRKVTRDLGYYEVGNDWKNATKEERKIQTHDKRWALDCYERAKRNIKYKNDY